MQQRRGAWLFEPKTVASRLPVLALLGRMRHTLVGSFGTEVADAGNRCGGRSAYSRPGGAAPLCYRADKIGRGSSRIQG